MKSTTLLVAAILCFAGAAQAQVYLDSTATTEDRVEDLLTRMTLEEKVGQMTQAGRAFLEDDGDIATYLLGSLLSGGGSAPDNDSPGGWADMVDGYQQHALSTRLKIPLIYGIDAVHGNNNVRGAVIFPHNIGLGATRNPDLVEDAARITAIEVAGSGMHWTFAPAIPVVRDERWGRTYEGFGETPALAQMLGAAAIRGFQGTDLSSPTTILATAKHFLGDGGTIEGDDQGNVELGETEFREIHLKGYVDAIQAGAGSVMATYNSWNGQKVHGSRYLLTDVLKDELGFNGFVISDWAAIDQLPGDYTSDIEQSINAGVDMVMVPDRYAEYTSTLITLVQQGNVPAERIEDAVRRILRVKFNLGLFERPLSDRSLTPLVGTADHRTVARQAVQQSLVVLTKKDGVLPLPASGAHIHVAGRHADDIGLQSGGWSISWQGSSGPITTGTTILEAIRRAAPGATITTSLNGQAPSGADIAVAVIGEDPYAEGAGDRADLHLSNADAKTVRNLKATGLPVVAVLITGRPMIIDNILPFTDAVVAAWLPGTEGDGVADVLFGSVDPVGTLPHSWPRSMDQIPINVGDAVYEPLFPYGHGLTSLEDSSPGAAPAPYAAVTRADGSAVDVIFTKAIGSVPSDGSGFFFVSDEPITPTSAAILAGDSTVVMLTLASPVHVGSTLQVGYSGGGVRSRDGGKLVPFHDLDVYSLGSNAATVPGRIEAEAYSNMFGIQTQGTSDEGGGINVGWIDTGDWLEYDIRVEREGAYEVTYRVAAESVAGRIGFRGGNILLSHIDLPVTGGWQVWTSVKTTLTLQKGVQTVRIVAAQGGFNLNWIEFEPVSGTAVDPSTIPNAAVSVYPNPIGDRASVRFALDEPSRVRFSLYDVLGRRVSSPFDAPFGSGVHHVRARVKGLAPGTYVYRLTTDYSIESGRVVVR